MTNPTEVSMVEKVARAIKADIGRQLSASPAPGGPSAADNWTATGGTLDLEQVARAAIEAMREPTEAMVQAGWPHTADPCWEHNVASAYRAMIDAALAPKA